MIDMHSHIIPGIDDGSKSIEQSLEMIRNAYNDGTEKIIATPHYCLGYAETQFNDVRKHFENLKKEVRNEEIDIEIYLGQEVYFSENIVNDYKQGVIGTINNSRYMLFETPMNNIDENTLDTIYELQILGIVPILAHPERYKEFIDDPKAINKFVKEGILLQMNAGSITGLFGKSVKKTAEILLANDLYNFIGSDAHNTKNRTTGLTNALNLANKINKNSSILFEESSLNVLNNEEVKFVGQAIKQKKNIFSLLSIR